MILVEKTTIKFGYNIENLKPNSCKMVCWCCDKCGCESDKKFRDAKKIKLCLKCSNKINSNKNLNVRKSKLKEWYKNHVHPLSGTKRPQYVIDAIKKAITGVPLSDETKKKLSIRNSGNGNPMYGKKHTKESLEKMCKIQKIKVRKGKNSNFYGKCYHGKGGWYECKNGSKIWMRSSWEIKFAEYLDNKNIDWLFEPRTFPIIYENKEGTYKPDFYLILDNLYIEIKGYWRDDAFIKFESFKEQYKDIKIDVYDGEKLKELKII